MHGGPPWDGKTVGFFPILAQGGKKGNEGCLWDRFYGRMKQNHGRGGLTVLTILMGRAKSGKSEWMLRRIAALGDSSRQILLVPEHASYAAEVDLCRACGDSASRHAEVLSFRRLAARVLAVTGGAADVSLDQGGKLLTLQKALGEVAPALKLYRRPSRKAAFLTSMLDLFDEFQSFAVTPEDLSRRGEELTGATGEKLRHRIFSKNLPDRRRDFYR